MSQEPRCQGACSGKVQPWIQMMAPYFKSIDPKHMVRLVCCMSNRVPGGPLLATLLDMSLPRACNGCPQQGCAA